MDATAALNQTDHIVTGLIAGLTPDQRENATPCPDWNVHDLIGHMCAGGHMVAGALLGDAPPADAPDYLADGPAKGWAETAALLRRAATAEVLGETHQMPFGDMPGEMALSIIVADALTHGWDLAQASGQPIEIDDELAAFALATWETVAPAEGRTGDAFGPALPVAEPSAVQDRLVAFTGRKA